MITIDGSKFSGGGQMLRTALALSASLNQPFVMENIRAGRQTPGLAHQHVACVRAVQELTEAEVEGDELQAQTLHFTPKELKAKSLNIEIPTAGASTLVLQSLLLPCAILDDYTTITLTGGTDVSQAIPADYFNEVIIPALSPYLHIKFSIQQRGYMPEGQGIIQVKAKKFLPIPDEPDEDEEFEEREELPPYSPPPISFTKRGQLLRMRVISHAAKDLMHHEVAERQAKVAQVLLNEFNTPVSLHTEYSDSAGLGSGVGVFIYFGDYDMPIDRQQVFGLHALGARGKSAKVVGEEAVSGVRDLIQSTGAIDEFLADNLIPFLGLFGGTIHATKITDHIRANIYVTELFLGERFKVDEARNTITVDLPYFL